MERLLMRCWMYLTVQARNMDETTAASFTMSGQPPVAASRVVGVGS